MTPQEFAKAVEVAIGTEVADRSAIATTVATFAVAKLSRMNGVDFNRKWLTFTLTAGTASYGIGDDLFAGEGDLYGIDEVWRTDAKGYHVEVLSNSRFNAYARGGSATGFPDICTIYGKPGDRTIEFYPIPDSAYAMGAMVQTTVGGVESIPDRYYDVLFAIAMDMLASAKNPMMAGRLAAEGLRDIQHDNALGVAPTTIHATRSIDENVSYRRTDSGRLR